MTYEKEIKKHLLDYFEFPNNSINTPRTDAEIKECQRREMPVWVAVEEIVWGVHSIVGAEEFCKRHGWTPDKQFYLDLAALNEREKKRKKV